MRLWEKKSDNGQTEATTGTENRLRKDERNFGSGRNDYGKKEKTKEKKLTTGEREVTTIQG